MSPFVKSIANNKILNQLIYTHCLSFGRSPKLNQKKINHYIFGTRQKFDIFKLYEMRYLILKVYPIIHNIFLQDRINQKKKRKWGLFPKNYDLKKENIPSVFWHPSNYWTLKNRFNRKLKRPIKHTLPPKILFATITPLYSQIIISAAKNCRMPFHVQRWITGTVTASSSTKNEKKHWPFFIKTFKDQFTNWHYRIKFRKQKIHPRLQKKKIAKSKFNRKPTLIIIPDIANNEPILRETNSLGIPTLGLVNARCDLEISYPIFANDLSFYSVHFFCHFLSNLILKELVKKKRKIFTPRKKKRVVQFSSAMKDIFRFQKRYSVVKIRHMQKHLKNLARKMVAKKISKKPHAIRHIQKMVRKNYQKKVSLFQKFVQNYFDFAAYQRKNIKPYQFPGRYYLDHFPRIRHQRMKKLRYEKKKKWLRQLKKRIISPKQILVLENRKRLKKHFSRQKKLLAKINFVKKVQAYNYTKILKAIRLPKYKPEFRYWHSNAFFYATPIKMTIVLPNRFLIHKYKMKSLLRRRSKKEWKKVRNKNNKSNKGNKRYYPPDVFKKKYQKQYAADLRKRRKKAKKWKYRKRWSLDHSKKKYHKYK